VEMENREGVISEVSFSNFQQIANETLEAE
jgi:hypothetical protein